MGIVHAPELSPYPADVLSMPGPMTGTLARSNNQMSYFDGEGEGGFLLHHEGPSPVLSWCLPRPKDTKKLASSKEFIGKDHQTDYDWRCPGCESAYRCSYLYHSHCG